MPNGNQSARATDYSINSGLSASPSEIHTSFLNPLIPCSFSLSSQIYIYILYIYVIYIYYIYIYNKYNIYIISNEFDNGTVLIKIKNGC